MKHLGLRKYAEKSAYDEIGGGDVSRKEAITGLLGGLGNVAIAEGLAAATGGDPTLSNSFRLGTVAGPLVTGGMLSGHLSRKNTLGKYSPASVLFPVAYNRARARDAYVDEKLSKGKVKHKFVLAESGGGKILNALLIGALSGIASAGYAAYSGGDRSKVQDLGIKGALWGAGSAFGANMLGEALGTLLPKRTDKEHAEYLDGSVLPHHLIPGYAGFMAGRRNRMRGSTL